MIAGNRPRAPLFATVNLTTRCNLDCAYCYMQPMSGKDITRADFERVIDELADAGVFLLTLSGGEPFLHPSFAHLFRYAHRRFAHVMTLTNGAAMQDGHIEVIQQVLDEKGALTIQVSLDAVDADINAITRSAPQRTLETIEKLTSVGCHVIVAVVVTRHNVAVLSSTIEAISAYTRWFHIMTVQDIRAREGVERELAAERTARDSLWHELRALADKRDLAINYPAQECEPGCATGAPCMAGFSHLLVDPDLDVRPCDRLTDIVLGNLGNANLSEIWNGAATLDLIRRAQPACRTPPIPGATPVIARDQMAGGTRGLDTDVRMLHPAP